MSAYTYTPRARVGDCACSQHLAGRTYLSTGTYRVKVRFDLIWVFQGGIRDWWSLIMECLRVTGVIAGSWQWWFEIQVLYKSVPYDRRMELDSLKVIKLPAKFKTLSQIQNTHLLRCDRHGGARTVSAKANCMMKSLSSKSASKPAAAENFRKGTVSRGSLKMRTGGLTHQLKAKK